MIKKYKDKNKFGKATIGIEIDTLHEIFIYETDAPCFVVELKEKGIFREKLIFSSISSNDLLATASTAIDKAYVYFQGQSRYEINPAAWTQLKNQVIEQLSAYSQTHSHTHPQLTDIPQGNIHLLYAFDMVHQKDYDAAIVALDLLFQTEPNNINAHLLFIEVYLSKGNLVKAREKIERIDKLLELGVVDLDVLQYRKLTDFRIRSTIPEM